MASSTIHSSNQTTRFQKDVVREYVRGGRFGPYIGKTDNAIIQVNNDLRKVSIPLVAKVGGAGKKGSSTLSGSEVALSNYAYTLQPTHYRQGVLVDNEENEKAEFDLFSEARPGLMNWAMEHKRDMIIQAMGAIEAGGVYYNYGGTEGAYGSAAAAAANMDTWLTNNADRVVYGNVRAFTAGNHTTSLSNVATTETMAPAVVSLLKRVARTASPLIRPVMLKGDEPWYVLFLGSYSFRDMRLAMDTIHQYAAPRSLADNPLFTGGDLVYDGVIIKEVPDIDKFIDGDSSGSPWDGIWGANAASADGLDNGGGSSGRLGIGFFCGAQALGFGMGKMPSFQRRKEDDYGHQNGVAVTMKHDIKKTFFNNKQHGMVTSFHAAATD
jgi:hypothetical protein